MKKLIILTTILFCLTSAARAGTGHGLAADGTLGTLVEKTGNLITITGGTAQSNNLFHSFSDFNVETGETADFVGTQNLVNIISRVTGVNDSWIDGKLKTTGTTANLYLLNPNGIMFGPNAGLDIQGSFHVSTADYLKSGGDKFYADAARSSILSVAPVEAFGFLDDSSGPIRFSGGNVDLTENSRLIIPATKEISIIGGEITIERYSIEGSAGRFIMASAGSAGEVTFTETAEPEMRLSITSEKSGNITAKDDVRLRCVDGGDFYIRGDVLTLEENSLVETNFGNDSHRDRGGVVGVNVNQLKLLDGGAFSGSSWVSGAKGTDIFMSVAGAAVMKGGRSYNSGEVFFSGIYSISGGNVYWRSDGGDGGDIRLKAERLTVAETAAVTADSVGSGNSGRIFIEAGEMTIGSAGRIGTATLRGGHGGDVELTVGALSMTGGRISTDAGKLVTATGTYVESWHSGDAGDITINADDILLTGGNSGISSNTYGMGRAGGIGVTARGVINLGDGAHLATSASSTGDAGRIILNAAGLRLDSGAYISSESGSRTSGGIAGSIGVNVKNSMEMLGGSHLSTTTYGTNTNGRGNIHVKAGTLLMDAGSYIVSESRSAGDIGLTDVDVKLDITHTYDSDLGVWLISPSQTEVLLFYGVGWSGDNFTNTILDDDAVASIAWASAPFSGSFRPEGSLSGFNGENPDGEWRLKIGDYYAGDTGTLNNWSLSLAGAGEFSSNPGESRAIQDGYYIFAPLTVSGVGMGHVPAADAGDVTINVVNEMVMGNAAYVSTTSEGTGRAGDITVTAGGLSLDHRAHVTSESAFTGAGGRAGTINIKAADDVNMANSAFFSTSSAGQGDAGQITLNAGRNLNLSTGAYISSESRSTATGAGRAGSLFITTGESIDMRNESRFTTESQNAGGGGITVNTRERLYLLNSWITTSVSGGDGRGGDIYIDPVFVVLHTVAPYTLGVNNSRIQANAYGGPGGNINIVTDYLVKSPGSVIEASSSKSSPGEITVRALDFDIADALADLDAGLLDVTRWSCTPCALRSGEKISGLIFTRGDALPETLDDFHASLAEALDSGLLEPDDNPNRRALPDDPGSTGERTGDDRLECAECN